jgi:hypothetical protein
VSTGVVGIAQSTPLLGSYATDASIIVTANGAISADIA